jgi:hypothetical protein
MSNEHAVFTQKEQLLAEIECVPAVFGCNMNKELLWTYSPP